MRVAGRRRGRRSPSSSAAQPSCSARRRPSSPRRAPGEPASALLALGRPRRAVAVEAGRPRRSSNEGGWLTVAEAPDSIAASDGRLSPDEEAAGSRRDRLSREHAHARGRHGLIATAGAAAAAPHGPRPSRRRAPPERRGRARRRRSRELAAPADTVALSLNKGLCAPYGAVLAGRRGDDRRGARDHLRRLGGGTVHKAWILAAAGLVALSSCVGRLADDHRRARELASLLGLPAPETNIVMTELPASALTRPRAARRARPRPGRRQA